MPRKRRDAMTSGQALDIMESHYPDDVSEYISNNRRREEPLFDEYDYEREQDVDPGEYYTQDELDAMQLGFPVDTSLRQGRYHPTYPGHERGGGMNPLAIVRGGLNIARDMYHYDPDDPWLRSKNGKYLYYDKVDSVLQGGGHHQTLNRVPATWLNDMGYNQLGLRTNVREERAPLRIQDEVFGPLRLRGGGDFPPPRSAVGGDFPPLRPPRSALPRGSVEDRRRASKLERIVSEKPEDSEGPKPYQHLTSISRPAVKNLPGGCCEFTNSEYIQDVISLNNQFSLSTIVVNPGLYSSFPVLSQIASAFIYYKFTKLTFRFVSTWSDSVVSSGTTSALGIVCMTHTDNVSIQPPGSMPILSNYPGAKTFKPSLNVKYEIDCSRAVADMFFVRSNPTFQTFPLSPAAVTETWGNAGQPTYPGAPQLTDYINFYIATSGMLYAATVGEIHVDYSVTLCSPFLYGSLGGSQNLYYRGLIGTIDGNPNSDGFVSPLNTGYGNLMMQVDSNGGNAMRVLFPPSLNAGCYHIQIYSPTLVDDTDWGGSNTTPGLTFPSFVGCKLLAPHAYGSASSSIQDDIDMQFSMAPAVYYNNTGAAGGAFYSYNVHLSGNSAWQTCMCISFYVQVTNPNAVITWPGYTGTFPGEIFQGSISVSQVNPNFQYSWSSGQGFSNP